MTRKKLKNRSIRKLSKTGGGSLYVTLPIDVIREFGWRKNQKVVIKKRGKGFSITDWKK